MHGDRPGALRLHDFVPQMLKHSDVRHELLGESERLLAGICERWNVAAFNTLSQLFELGQVLVDF